MFDWLKRAFAGSSQHRITMPGLDISISENIRVVWVVDQTGGSDPLPMAELGAWLHSKGYFLHAVIVEPDAPRMDKNGSEIPSQ